MATLCAKVGAAAILAGTLILASAAHACDERYPATCKQPPAASSSESAGSRSATSKPLQISTRRRGTNAKTTKDTTERAAQVSRKRHARKAAVRRLAARSRHAKAEVEVAEVETRSTASSDAEPAEAVGTVDAVRKEAPQRAQRSLRTASAERTASADRVADGSSESRVGFASVWKDRTIVTAEASEFVPPSPPSSEPASAPAQPPVRVASQNDVNEMDLAAADATASANSFWLRGLFLALGGLLAVGSALRFLV